jgi:hypothetical protein
MPNDLTISPWIVDTPGAGVLSSDVLAIETVRWVGATTAGHVAEITNAADRMVWRSVAAGANHVEAEWLNAMLWTGLKVPTLGSGVLYITVTRRIIR